MKIDTKRLPEWSQNQCPNSSKINDKTDNEKGDEHHQRLCFHRKWRCSKRCRALLGTWYWRTAPQLFAENNPPPANYPHVALLRWSCRVEFFRQGVCGCSRGALQRCRKGRFSMPNGAAQITKNNQNGTKRMSKWAKGSTKTPLGKRTGQVAKKEPKR